MLEQSNNSKNHHWWPTGLQRYWEDQNKDIACIKPDGTIVKRKRARRKVGHKRHGHTALKGGVWQTKFEDDFNIDNEVHRIVSGISNLKPLDWSPKGFLSSKRPGWENDRNLLSSCKYYDLNEELHRNLLLFLYSLLIRSPATRSRYENAPSMVGLPPDEDVGKINMAQNYRFARELCQDGPILNHFFAFLFSPMRQFTFGDGSLDRLTGSLTALRISGLALVPLTPSICVYFCSSGAMRSSATCASITAAPWVVDWVNQTSQIYSKDCLFFLDQPPELIKEYKRNEFLEYSEGNLELIMLLDELALNKKQ